MTLEEYKKEVEKNIKSLFEKANEEEKELLNTMVNLINDLCEEKQELIDYLNKEIEELTKEYYLENQQLKEKLDCDLKWAFKCDELTKENQKLKEQLQQNEDIYNEVSKILSKIEKE